MIGRISTMIRSSSSWVGRQTRIRSDIRVLLSLSIHRHELRTASARFGHTAPGEPSSPSPRRISAATASAGLSGSSGGDGGVEAPGGTTGSIGASAGSDEGAVVAWIGWYNHDRLHSAIGNIPPAEHEQAYATRSEPAA